MSDGSYAAGAGVPGDAGSGESGVVDDAKHEASALRDTVTGATKDVAGTAKDEAASVAREAKHQIKDLYLQARDELADQASAQQKRIAAGLGAVGEELGAMARNAEGGGIAADLVQRVSARASSASTWLGDRDPSALLADVRAFARRRPAVFIGAALVAGAVTGRLVRALAEGAKQDAAAASVPAPASGSLGSSPIGAGESPLYAESAARYNIDGEETPNERSDTF